MPINIDYSRDERITEFARKTLEDRYFTETEKSPQEAFARACESFADDEEHAQRMYDYVSKGWMMFSTPILSNGGTKRGMPIACFGGYVPDSREGICNHYTENAWLSSMGGGIGGYWGDIRSDGEKTSKGSKSTGSIPFMKVVDSQMLAFSQGSSRRGSYAAYQDISHPEIEEFVNIRKPTGGDMNRKSINLHHAVILTDEFMKAVENGDEWNLIDPKSKRVTKTIDAQHLWMKILDNRVETGEPYIMFKDTCNNAAPQEWKDAGLEIKQSNLCVSGDTIITILDHNNYKKDIKIKDLQQSPDGNWKRCKVLAYNIIANSFQFSDIKNFAMTNPSAKTLTIHYQGKKLTCTPDHSIYTLNRGYVEAQDLNENDILMLSRNSSLPYSHSEHHHLIVQENRIPIPVYDITVDDNHNFFANDILVHNCSEILLPTNEERTFVCCLSSVNLEYFDEWKSTRMVRDITRFLDNVLTFFIDNAPAEVSRAVHSAKMSRDIGIGAMGFHAFLQKKMIPFESVMAKTWNKKMFEHIKFQAALESAELATERGSCPDALGNNKRNMSLLAVAPNASSAIICDTSPSIEPYVANAFTQKTLTGSFIVKNKYLTKLLESIGKNTKEVWKSINANSGSVQHLDFLSEFEKDIFKTAPEIDQHWLIEHAADRQKEICQSQSLNLFFDPIEGKIDARYLHSVHMSAWKKGVKTLYYVRSKASKRVENVSIQVERKKMMDSQTSYDETSCLSCEG